MKYRPPPEPLPNVERTWAVVINLDRGVRPSPSLRFPRAGTHARSPRRPAVPAAASFDEAPPECQRHWPQASRGHRQLRGAAGDFVRFHAVRRPVAPGAAVPSPAPPSTPCLVLNVRLPHGARMTSRKHAVVILRRRTIHHLALLCVAAVRPPGRRRRQQPRLPGLQCEVLVPDARRLCLPDNAWPFCSCRR